MDADVDALTFDHNGRNTEIWDDASPLTPASTIVTYGPITRIQHNAQLMHQYRDKLEHALGELTRLRRSGLGMRLDLEQHRNSLRGQRQDITDLEARLDTAMGNFASNRDLTDIANVQDLIAQVRFARDRYGQEEMQYNDREYQLDQQQFTLQEAEEKFYNQHVARYRLLFEQNPDAVLVEPVEEGEESSTSTPSALWNQEDPLMEQFLSRQGDESLLKEQIADLRHYHARLLDDQSAFNKVGRSLDDESLQFLAEFDVQQEQLKEELAHVEADVTQLRRACEDAGLLHPLKSTDEISLVTDWEHLDLGDGSESGTLDPLLLPDETHSTVFSAEYLSGPNHIMSKTQYIGSWLLHHLRASTLQIRRFKALGDLQNLPISGTALRDLVLEWWPKDDASRHSSTLRRASAGSSSAYIRPNRTTSIRSVMSDSVLRNMNRRPLVLHGGLLSQTRGLANLGLPSRTDFQSQEDRNTPHSL